MCKSTIRRHCTGLANIFASTRFVETMTELRVKRRRVSMSSLARARARLKISVKKKKKEKKKKKKKPARSRAGLRATAWQLLIREGRNASA